MRFSMLGIAVSLWMAFSSAIAGEQSPSAHANSQKTTEEMCRETVCQHDVHVVLRQKDGAMFDRTFDVMPGVVQPHWLVILAGQTLYIEADRSDDRLTDFRVVESVTHPEKTLTVTLQQSDDGSMLLKVTNPFSQSLKFKMGMMPLDSDKLLKTSSCPVMAGGSSFESWPEPIFQVVLANARFIDPDKAQLACD